LPQQQRRSAIAVAAVAARSCYSAAGATALLLLHIAALPVPWRYSAAVEFYFFLLDSLRRENESEKEKNKQDSKPVSRIY
jgi:hypothetical protein